MIYQEHDNIKTKHLDRVPLRKGKPWGFSEWGQHKPHYTFYKLTRRNREILHFKIVNDTPSISWVWNVNLTKIKQITFSDELEFTGPRNMIWQLHEAGRSCQFPVKGCFCSLTSGPSTFLRVVTHSTLKS